MPFPPCNIKSNVIDPNNPGDAVEDSVIENKPLEEELGIMNFYYVGIYENTNADNVLACAYILTIKHGKLSINAIIPSPVMARKVRYLSVVYQHKRKYVLDFIVPKYLPN